MNATFGSTTHAPRPIPASIDSQVQLLRSRVESELKKPAVVMVTSAHPGDGKSMTATALATSFAKYGQRAALVSENRSGLGSADSPAAKLYSHGHATNVELPPEDDNAVSREELTAFVSAMRSQYDYTIVDAGSFLTSHSAMALTGLVDGILLTVRVGRASTEKDDMMVRMIENLRSTVIGVVATDSAAVADFARQNRPEPAAESPRARSADRKPARVLVTTVLSGLLLVLLSSSSQAGQAGTTAFVPVGNVRTQIVQASERVRETVSRYVSSPILASLKD